MSGSGKAAKIQAIRRVDVFGLIMKRIRGSENCIATADCEVIAFGGKVAETRVWRS